jgi:hypothetical protein
VKGLTSIVSVLVRGSSIELWARVDKSDKAYDERLKYRACIVVESFLGKADEG